MVVVPECWLCGECHEIPMQPEVSTTTESGIGTPTTIGGLVTDPQFDTPTTTGGTDTTTTIGGLVSYPQPDTPTTTESDNPTTIGGMVTDTNSGGSGTPNVQRWHT